MKHYVCGCNIQRMGEFAKWPGANPRLPWNVDLSGYRGNMTAAMLIEAFRLAWLWWAESAEINPVMVQTAGEALIRKHFARIDGPSGVLAWSELADNTNQPKTQRYDAGDNWILSETFQGGMDLARVACHEIGHVLGLEHDSQSSKSLMAPYIQEDVRKPTARDIQRLIGLGYKKRTTPLPDGPPDDVPAPNHIRLSQAMQAGAHGGFVLGSDLPAGDYIVLLGGDGANPTVPNMEEF